MHLGFPSSLNGARLGFERTLAVTLTQHFLHSTPSGQTLGFHNFSGLSSFAHLLTHPTQIHQMKITDNHFILDLCFSFCRAKTILHLLTAGIFIHNFPTSCMNPGFFPPPLFDVYVVSVYPQFRVFFDLVDDIQRSFMILPSSQCR
jgi:hypothetical protein